MKPVPRGHGERILLLDDEPTLTAVGERRLQALGYDVTTFNDPREALAAFRKEPERFDLVMTDFSMPNMDGVQFARYVNAVRRDVPILLATGYMDEFPDSTIAAAGIRQVLSKPMTLATLGESVASLLSTR